MKRAVSLASVLLVYVTSDVPMGIQHGKGCLEGVNPLGIDPPSPLFLFTQPELGPSYPVLTIYGPWIKTKRSGHQWNIWRFRLSAVL